MKSSRLSTEPWWTPTFTSNSSLYPSPTRTWLRALAYIPYTSTIHSSTPSFFSAHQLIFKALDQTPSLRPWKPCRGSCWQLDTSLAAAWQQRLHLLCLCWDEAKLGIVNWHQLSDKAVQNPLQVFHDLLCQLETTVVAPFQCIPLSLVVDTNWHT